MKISDLLSMCVRNLTRRKFRTFLTITGVVIGTCAIVVMISLGVGISVSNEQMLENFGDLTIIDVYPQSSENVLNDDAVAGMEALFGVEVVAPTMRFNDAYMELVAGRKDRYSAYADLQGVYPEALEKLKYEVTEGALELGEENKKIKIIVGPMVAYRFRDTKKRGQNAYIDYWVEEGQERPEPFFNPYCTEDLRLLVHPNDPEKKTLEYELIVSGTLLTKENGDWEKEQAMYISIDDLKRIQAEYRKENNIKKDANTQADSYETVKVKVDHIDNVAAVVDGIKEMGFYPQSMEEMRQGMQEQTQTIQMILGALGGVSLFVAAISITNTMIMSVYERTREIGVMKVLGCLVGNIRTVFLLEAGLIGFLGGVLGIGVSYLLSYLMNTFGGAVAESMYMMAGEGTKLSIIPPWLVLLGLTFATVIGLVSGFYPANRAVRISALEAIKQE